MLNTCWGLMTVSRKTWGSKAGVKPEEMEGRDNGYGSKLDPGDADFRHVEESTCLYSTSFAIDGYGYERKHI